MVARILMFLLIFSPFAASLQGLPPLNYLKNAFTAEERPSPQAIKVLLVSESDGVLLAVKGRYKIYDARNMQLIGTRYLGKRKFLQGVHGGLLWGEEFPGVHQIAIVPDDPKTTISVDGVEYQGSIFAYDVGGTISMVNHVDVENYLSVILPSAYQLPQPEEALNAAAIAARTNAYYQAQSGRSPYWDVEAAKVGYSGAPSTNPSEISLAIKNTQWMILNKSAKSPWVATPFPAHWKPQGSGPVVIKGEYSKITFEDAARLAENGQDAAQILGKAFPEARIDLVY